jgi:hypothetical protein
MHTYDDWARRILAGDWRSLDRLHSRILRWSPVTFFAVAPLGLVGLEADEAARTGDRPRAAAILGEFLRTEPASVAGLGPSHLAEGKWETEAALYFGQAREAYADALSSAGRVEEAEVQRRRAAEVKGAIR